MQKARDMEGERILYIKGGCYVTPFHDLPCLLRELPLLTMHVGLGNIGETCNLIFMPRPARGTGGQDLSCSGLHSSLCLQPFAIITIVVVVLFILYIIMIRYFYLFLYA